jgi:hypothetical protein
MTKEDGCGAASTITDTRTRGRNLRARHSSNSMACRVLGLFLALVAGCIVTVASCWYAALGVFPGPSDKVEEFEQVHRTEVGWYIATAYSRRYSGRQDRLGRMLRLYCATWRWGAADEPGAQDRMQRSLDHPGDPREMAVPAPSTWLMPWLYGSEPYRANRNVERHLFTYGWPFPAMGQLRQFLAATGGGGSVMTKESSLPVPKWMVSWLAPKSGLKPVFAEWEVPTRLLWPGFVANSLMWTALAWVVGFAMLNGIRAMRRGVRRRRDRCLLCGYDRRGLARDAACPECGTCLKCSHTPGALSSQI